MRLVSIRTKQELFIRSMGYATKSHSYAAAALTRVYPWMPLRARDHLNRMSNSFSLSEWVSVLAFTCNKEVWENSEYVT